MTVFVMPFSAGATSLTMLAALAPFLCCCSACLLSIRLLMLGTLHSVVHHETYMLLVRCPGWLIVLTVFERFVN